MLIYRGVCDRCDPAKIASFNIVNENQLKTTTNCSSYQLNTDNRLQSVTVPVTAYVNMLLLLSVTDHVTLDVNIHYWSLVSSKMESINIIAEIFSIFSMRATFFTKELLFHRR